MKMWKTGKKCGIIILIKFIYMKNNVAFIDGQNLYMGTTKNEIDINKFEKIMFPNNNASSLYKELGNKYFIYLNRKDIKDRIS